MGKRNIDPETASVLLGQKIRELRYKKGWTLEDTEDHGWPSWRHMQTVETGKNITFHTLIAIANLYGVRPSSLLEDI
jgi:transcriptional regulator with XRE-family HTH domain